MAEWMGRTALELVRYGGRQGVDWDAKEPETGLTAQDLAQLTLNRRILDEEVDVEMRIEMEQVRELLKTRRLPVNEVYVFPCMDPDFCRDCGVLGCRCPENDVSGMPGSYS